MDIIANHVIIRFKNGIVINNCGFQYNNHGYSDIPCFVDFDGEESPNMKNNARL